MFIFILIICILLSWQKALLKLPKTPAAKMVPETSPNSECIITEGVQPIQNWPISLLALIHSTTSFLSFPILQFKHQLSVSNEWQYLQLQHLLVTMYGSTVLSISKSPKLLEWIIGSLWIKCCL